MATELPQFRSADRGGGIPLPPGLAPFDACSDSLVLAEANHRIANHLALLAGTVRLQAADVAAQAAEPTRASMRLMLQGLGAQVGAVSRLHRTLAMDQRRTSVDLREHLHEACAPFRSRFGGGTRLIEDVAPGCIVRPDQVLPLVQIVTEAVINALKYADAAGDGGAILVRCRQGQDGTVEIEVADDGRGFPPGFDPATDGGLGFRLIRALAKRLGALMEIGSAAPGASLRLTLPPALA